MEAGAAAESGVFGDDHFVRMNGAGGPAWTERLPVQFEWLAAA